MRMSEMTDAYVKLDKVSKIYGTKEVKIVAVDEISFEIAKGEFVVIVGPSGAGKTTVMVTLGTGEEMIYALDTQSGDMQSQQTHVLLEDGSALTETVCVPQVCGVAVLCEGGADVRIAARITELVSALLDLPSNHICVEQRKG